MDIVVWLRSLGLGQYEAAFRDNEIDETVLPNLTAEDLKDLGVSVVGHRRKLLDAIAALRTEAGTKAPSPDAANTSSAPTISFEDHAERRQITVMFSDLVGSTSLSARMDPEDLRELISAYHKCVADTVRRFDGFVGQYLGDGVLVYFGYPEAHEDDAERAVRAGLELIEAMTALKTPASLQTRVGIATGLVVVGDLMTGSGEAHERRIVGETPNLAARLQGIAEPNTVVIAEATRRLLGNLFELRDLGGTDLKGVAEPLRAWVALRASAVESRFEALHPSGLTALVGREEETELLLRRWSRAKNGEGQVVLISGEAGIGKSRLTAALLENLAPEPHGRLRYFCSPQHIDSAFSPIIGQMERAAGLLHDDTSQQKLDKLDALFAQTSTSIHDAALIAEMLSLPNDGRYPALELTPQQRRQKTLEALTAHMKTLSRQKPVLMIFEDAQWADPTSLEVFSRVVDQIQTLRVLLLVTFRPEFDAPWVGRPYVTARIINRLAEHEASAMIDRIVGNKQLSASIRQDIIERTDGIPLFVEEMTKAVLEAGSETAAARAIAAVPSPALAVPASLYASLMARLDRLGAPVKELAQIAAAIGREFSHVLLASVVRQPEAALRSTLNRLIAAGLLFRQGVPPHATYLFKHALVQDAAYGTLLREPRRALHARIAETLEGQFVEVAETQPELLARHFTEAGLSESAVEYWFKAGKRAESRSANIEAVRAFAQGIEIIQSLPRSRDRARKELDLYLALGPAMAATQGYAASETLNAFLHAGRLLTDDGTSSEQMTVLWGSHMAHSIRAEHIAAHNVANQILTLGSEQRHPGLLALGNRFLGGSLWMMGAFVDARSHLEQTIEICAANEQTITTYRKFGSDDQVIAWSMLSRTLWILGYLEKATALGEKAVARARSLGLPFTTGHALEGEALLGVLGADLGRAAVLANESLNHNVKHSLTDIKHRTLFMHGALLAKRGDVQQGIEVMQSANAAIERTNHRNRRTLYLGHIAAAHASLGQPEIGLSLLDDALQTVETTSERFFEAELYRLRGELLLMLGNRDRVEGEFRRALAVARQQQARFWELRAAISVARLWRNEGKRNEARDLLAPVYGWFTEGFNTGDLQEAKALLDGLAAE